MVRRFFGILIVGTGIFGLVLGAIGLSFTNRFIDQLTGSIDSGITLAITNLDNVHETLNVTKSSLQEVNIAIDTVETTALNVSMAITETRPFLDAVSQVAATDVPNSIEGFQNTVPSIADVAAGVDDALTALSNFSFATQLMGFDMGFDLGINYAPETPFDESITDLGTSLEGLPESLRALDTQIAVTTGNLTTISQDISQLSGNIGDINDELRRFDPVIDGYIKTVTDLRASTVQMQGNVDQQIDMLKTAVNLLFLWLALMQIAPLYIGSKLIFGKKDDVLIP